MSYEHSLAHTKWDCKYHVVFAPKYRRKVFYGQKRYEIGQILVVSIIFRKFRNAIGNESNQPVLFCSLISSFSSSNRCCMLRYRLAPQSVPAT